MIKLHLSLGNPGRPALAAVFLLAMAAGAAAQTAVGVGNPGPVVKQQGLLGTYYNNTGAGGAGLGPPPVPPPGSPIGTPNGGLSVLFLQRVDATVNFDFQATPPPGVNNTPTTADHFCVVWEGFIKITTPSPATYQFATATDDGERAWFNDLTTTTPPINQWQQQGETQSATVTLAGLTTGTRIPFRFEFYEHEGGASARLRWDAGAMAMPVVAPATIIPATNLEPPDGPVAPTANATVTPNSPTPQVDVSWTAGAGGVAADTWIVMRGTAAGGPFTQIAVLPVATTTFADTTVVFGTTYFYRVQGTSTLNLLIGTPSAVAPAAGVTPVQPALTFTPAGPIVTSEAGLNATLTFRVNVQPTADVNVQITSSKPLEANFTAPGVLQGSPINVLIPNGTPVGTTIAVVVHGLDDLVADGPQAYQVTFVVSGGGAAYSGLTLPAVNGTNNDNDTPGITVTPISSPTTESGGTATIVVTFNTAPTVSTTIAAVSSNTAEAVVTSIVPNTFTALNFSSPHVITITGVDDTLLDFTQPYTITISVTGGDPAYTAMAPISVAGTNLDNETIPELPHVWGKGGCGLTGLEVALLLGAGAAWRRRRRRIN